MLVSAWKEKYHPLKFPIEQVCFLLMSKYLLVPQTTTKQGHHGREIRLSSGQVVDKNVPMNYSLVANDDLSRFRRERVIVNAMKKVMSLKSNQPTSRTRHLLGTFAASHPQISTMHQEQIIVLAQMSLLSEVRAVAEDKYSWLGADFAWLTLEMSPIRFHRPHQLSRCPCLRSVYDLLAEDAGGNFVLPIRWRANGARG
jgi:hypothetical protein